MITVTLDFHLCSDRLPDDEITVLMALADGDVLPGFQDGGSWRYADAMPCEIEVTHWAHMPEHPATRSEP